jgi:hypothetical protein
MLKLKFKFLGKYGVLLFLVSTLISCEESENYYESADLNQSLKTTASFVSRSQPDVVNTSQILNGTWESIDSGSKSKWIFNDGELLKNNIYSFGEAGEPQKYEVEIQKTCEGKESTTGKYILMKLQGSDEKRKMCYKIISYSENKVRLESKHGHSIILKK